MNRYIHISYKYKVAMINSIKQDFFYNFSFLVRKNKWKLNVDLDGLYF